MSDLAATNCGCNECGNNNGGCGSILWIIILLSCCGNGFGGNGCGNGCGNNGFGGDSCILIIILLLCCGGNDCGFGC